MVFSTFPFISVFLPIVWFLQTLSGDILWKNIFLLAASLIFYTYGGRGFVALLAGSSFLAWGMALLIEKTDREAAIQAGRGVKASRRKNFLLLVSCALHLGLLGYFKYACFFVEIVNSLLGLSIPDPGITLPIGISFYTFQAMSYVIDVYRGNCKAQKNFANLLLYISFFPQLIAGPIVRYHDIEQEIVSRKVTFEGTFAGMVRFTQGLAKKILIADVCAQVADSVFGTFAAGASAGAAGVAAGATAGASAAAGTVAAGTVAGVGAGALAGPGQVGMAAAWLGAAAFMLQIYYDFSGYSDMAIGMGQMFGFHFRENFNDPYAASSVRDFWTRWHISLSEWLREYLYYPLGGNRKGRARTVFNRLLVFALCGLWHGAGLTFLFWGVYHGLLTAFEGLIPFFRKDRKHSPVGKIFMHIYTILAVLIGFVFFKAGSLTEAFRMIGVMFGVGGAAESVGFAGYTYLWSLLTPENIAMMAVGVLFCVPRRKILTRGKDWAGAAVSLILLALCVIRIATNNYSPFIYFSF